MRIINIGTRNSDRIYTEELWDNRVFGSPDVMEALQTKTLFGELDHPEGDRCETLAKNAAITITKLEKKPEEGVIYGEAEILDTPTGRIVKALADSGAQLGISSRGMGEEIYEEGKNIIDPETYDFITFDVVVTPANTKARVSLTESKHINKLTESLKKEISESDTLNQLNQIKTVLESVNIENKNNLLNEVETKSNIIKNKSNKLLEKNKDIAIAKMKEKLKILDETNNANKEISKENKSLVETVDYYKESKELLSKKLKESKEQVTTLLKEKEENNNKVTSLTEEVKNLKTENKELKTNKETILLENKNNEKALKLNNNNLSKINETLTDTNKELIEEKNKLNEKCDKLVNSNMKLINENKELQKYKDMYSKIVLENKKLSKQLENAKLEIDNNKSKLTESRTTSNTKIKELEEQIKVLQSENSKLEESKDTFSKLSFIPLGTVSAISENINTGLSKEEQALFNVLTNKE